MREAEPEKPLQLALLSPCYWPEVRRGAERFVRELANGLLARGHNVTLITSHGGWPRRTVEAGLEVLRLPRPPQLRGYYEDYLTHVPLSLAALCLRRFDVAHAVYPTDALAAAAWSAHTGRPAVLSYMGTPERSWLAARKHRLEILARAVERCDAVVALSGHAAEAFRRWLGHDPRVIHPGVDLEAFRPTARDPRPMIVCSAAADVPRKHVPLLVEAFARVRQVHPQARLVLSRPSGTAAAARIAAALDAPGIEWANLDELPALARACGEAWVAALPAVDEAFGLVLVEALASGTPAVGYSHAGIPEIIDRPGIGRLFDQLDPGVLADALLEGLELARDPATAERCRARAGEFSTDRCAQQYLELYRELLQAPDRTERAEARAAL